MENIKPGVVDGDKSRQVSINPNEIGMTKLAKLTFWESYHQDGKNDWFIDHKQVLKALREDARLDQHFNYDGEEGTLV